jgi:DNA-binding winged helix-turn-helix (wHTH) protein
MLTSVTYRLGQWTFVPSAHELRCGAARTRLEQRASATLALLCERRGEVVSRQEIIDRAWGRRHLSANSVAVVIGDLRRALDIAAGGPGSIETVPKAGYRLIGGSEGEPKRRRWKRGWLGLLAVVVALAAIIWPLAQASSARPQILVAAADNATGSHQFDPLIRACSETVLVALGRHAGDLRVVEAAGEGEGPEPDYVLQQRWVLWSGKPELVLVATDRGGRAVWSRAIYGDEDRFPARISDEIGDFAGLARSGFGGN